MRKKKNYKLDKGGLYIAITCFALIAAVIGYVGNKKEEEPNSLKIATKYNFVNEDIKTDTNVPSKKQSIKKEEELTQSKPKVQYSNKTQPKEDAQIPVSAKSQDNEISFKKPVDGDVITEFSNTTLVFNELSSDWRTHNGIDISCDKDAAIYSAADGVVSSVTETSLGKTVIIDHQNGYITKYSNLSEQIEVISGDSVNCGDLIAKVGQSAVADFTNEPHLHFEILLNDKYVNPTDYIK